MIVHCTKSVLHHINFAAMATRERIVEEALDQFNQRGVNHVGVREIARSLGISPGNMSYHFARKEDLLTELLLRMGKENQAIRQQYLTSVPGLAGFMGMMAALFRSQHRYRGIVAELVEVNRLLSAHSGMDYPAHQRDRLTELQGMLTALCEQGKLQVPEADMDNLVASIASIARFWVAESFLEGPGIGEEEAVLHHVGRVRWLLGLFVTESGREALDGDVPPL